MERFELLYETVDDIDLYIGGVSERPVVGAVTGPTFQVKLRAVLASQNPIFIHPNFKI